MLLTKRNLLQAGLAAALPFAAASAAHADPAFAPRPGRWRRFEVTTRLAPATNGAPAQAWIPMPSHSDPDWIAPLGESLSGGVAAREVSVDGARMLHVTWEPGAPATPFEATVRFASRDRATDWGRRRAVQPLSAKERATYLAGSELAPVDGRVRSIADGITAGVQDDRGRAEAVYQWVVKNTWRDPAVAGCGKGDVVAMLESGRLGGKCADINRLFVALLRASGVPARELYGVRVAPSQFGYRSLGANSEVVSKAQHCRAEAWLSGHGWVAMDPADVRKVMLEEVQGGLPLDDPRVAAVRGALFGGWESNWLPYNSAADLALPGAAGPKAAYLMYPQVEVAGVRLDCLSPDTAGYAIHAREIV
jgi:transglutaminase-like putative cysteine protease